MSAACRKGSARSCARIGGLGSATSHPAASCRRWQARRTSPREAGVARGRCAAVLKGNPVGSPSLSLDLDKVRDALIRMEDSIIFAIIGTLAVSVVSTHADQFPGV